MSVKQFTLDPKTLVTLFLTLIFSCSSAYADLILTAPPRESEAIGIQTYGPLAKQLSEVLGVKVIYQQPRSWLVYQRDMRGNKYDIIFDGPHFISWRIQAINHKPVVMLPGKLGFILITKKNNGAINKIDDLTNRTLCAISPPNLSTLSVLAEMKNPVRQPVLVTGKGGMQGVWQRYMDGRCEAAIMRDKFFAKKIPAEQQSENKVIFKSVPVANQGITVGPNVTEEMRQKMVDALLQEGNPGAAPLLKRFAASAKALIAAKAEDYGNSYQLLTDVLFGWDIIERDKL